MNNKKYNLNCVIGLLLSFIPLINIVGVILCIRGLLQLKKKGETGKIMAFTGIIVGTIEFVVLMFFIISTYNYYTKTLVETRRYEIVDVATQTINKASEQYTYDNQSGLITEDTGYHVYNINNIGVNTKRQINDYFGYVVVDATKEDYYEYILFISSSKLELVNYKYFEYGKPQSSSDKIVKYNDKDMPHSAKDVCNILNTADCYGEDGLLVQ